MDAKEIGVLRFEEQYFERIWGGNKLHTIYNKDIPQDKPIGEAWLISDHQSCESKVTEGPLQGKTLRQLLELNADAILGTRAELTIHGRFPLLLKILDALDVLSVQVHPDDECAKRLNEPDVGKTEMWHVLQAEKGSKLICGLDTSASKETLAEAIQDGSIEKLMRSFEVEDGTSVHVPAGTVHAIGAGIVLTEIQQNSDLTYRLYDWGRLQNGKPRQLHIEKSMEAINFGSTFGGSAKPLAYDNGDTTRTVLAACIYFATELIEVSGHYSIQTRGESFHIILLKSGELVVDNSYTLQPGQAILVPGHFDSFSVEGNSTFLNYYVPNLDTDIIAPLTNAGHQISDIHLLGGKESAE